jgi:hypothetical protein
MRKTKNITNNPQPSARFRNGAGKGEKMDKEMTIVQWTKLASSLKFRRAQLERDLEEEDYDAMGINSVTLSKREQIEAINILLGQVPSLYK